MNLTLTLKSFLRSAPSNEILMARFAQSGDNTLLAQLYDSCGNELYHFIKTQSDETLAKDICQRTWLKVIEKKHLYQNSGSFKGWLYTLARNLLIDERRKHARLVEQYSETASPTLVLVSLEKRFDQALMRLPFEQREAFCLQQEGFGLQDIAQITHIGIETVKSRLRYAKTAMRKDLEKYHD